MKINEWRTKNEQRKARAKCNAWRMKNEVKRDKKELKTNKEEINL